MVMNFEYLFIANLLIFLGIIAYEDLKTSLISDKYPLTMSIIALILYLILCIFYNNCHHLIYAIIGGLIFLMVGYAMYYLGQWGEGDALVLAATIFSFPKFDMLNLYINTYTYFWFVFFINLSFVGVIYSLIYTLIYSFKKPSFYRLIFSQIKNHIIYLIGGELAIIGLYTFFYIFYGIQEKLVFSLWVAAYASMYLLYFFAKTADTYLFTVHKPLKDVREGDTVIGNFEKADFRGVLLDAITKEDIRKLIKYYGEYYKVEIKDMVRYAPSFLLGVLLTLLISDKLIMYLVK